MKTVQSTFSLVVSGFMASFNLDNFEPRFQTVQPEPIVLEENMSEPCGAITTYNQRAGLFGTEVYKNPLNN